MNSAPSATLNTPPRDRLPFPPSSTQSPSVPTRASTAPSISTPSFSGGPSPAVPNQPTTLDALLASHATASSPSLAALEQAISERNVLSSQNSQLWKLIEKQRSGYNQILKELERVRSERDTYKTRLHALGGDSVTRRQKSGDRQHSLQTLNPDQESAKSNDPTTNPKHILSRNHSDDLTTPRSTLHQIHASRSQEPLSSRDRTFQSNQSSLSLGSAAAPSRNLQKPAPPPLLVPPRNESLPVPSSATSATLETMPFGWKAHSNPTPSLSSHPTDSSPRHVHSDSLNIPLSTITRPLAPRRPSIGDTPLHIHTQPSSSHSQGSSPSKLSAGSNSLHTPQTAPAGLMPQFVAASPVQLQPQLQLGQLGAIHEDDARRVISRESRISLPDEARQYIANMVDSPIPSPQVDVGFTARIRVPDQKPKLTDDGPPIVTIIPASLKGKSGHDGFLDMEDEDEGGEDDVDDEGQPPGQVHEQPSLPEPEQQQQQQQQQQEQQPRQQRDLPDQRIQDQQHEQQLQLDQQQPGRSRNKPRAAAEDFPLPPSNSIPLAVMHESTSPDASQSLLPHSIPLSFRALPLLASDLPQTQITVSHSSVRPNERGKDVLSFVVVVSPGAGKEVWKVEKLYSDVIALDQRIRTSIGKGIGKKLASLPEGKLWKDHAPAKVDQRKIALETYLQSVIRLPIKNKDEIVAFFTSDIIREAKKPVSQVGYKEGYLTKRGKNFGGWKSRYFVLQGPILEYYESRGGAHLGSITVTGAQIGRQQRSGDKPPTTDEEKEYRHAFLIVEAKKGPNGNHPRHVLCAESDQDRDEWVSMLVRYFSGTYSEDTVVVTYPEQSTFQSGGALPRSSTSSNSTYDATIGQGSKSRPSARGLSREDITISKGPAVPISQLPHDSSNAKLFQSAPPVEDIPRSISPSKSPMEPSPTDRQPPSNFSDAQTARRLLEKQQPSTLPDPLPLSSSLPTTSPLDSTAGPFGAMGRANSEMGNYPDLQDQRQGRRQHSPETHRTRPYQPSLNTVSSPTLVGSSECIPSPDKLEAKVKISGPLNGAPIPSGFKFGGKDAPLETTPSSSDRREKAKSRSFWGFGRPNGSEKTPVPHIPRAVFGVPLEESLDVAQIANLPAIVFRSIEYLQVNKADQEEGIYRLSGSSAVIKSLKDKFNAEGDVDLVGSGEYWDPHAIAGLLKSFLRELPASILTRDLHLKFLAVIDFVDPQERIKELSQLISALPIANYSLLRALTAHLILIVQNSAVNKMTMRNVGIVFSPTLGIPAGVFSLMLGEFNRVFNVNADNEGSSSPTQETTGAEGNSDRASEMDRRNSKQYTDAAADQLLGLSGRSLSAPAEEGQSDGDEYSLHYESGAETTEGEATVESSSDSSPGPESSSYHDPDVTPATPTNSHTISHSKASHAAATRGLNIAVSTRGNRHSRILGLPHSPRPGANEHSPYSSSSSPSPSTMQTPKQ